MRMTSSSGPTVLFSFGPILGGFWVVVARGRVGVRGPAMVQVLPGIVKSS